MIYKELIVWQKSMELVKEIYSLVKKLPKDETYSLSDQMRRAATSIPSNIAEGLGRSTDKDKGHYMQIAYSSLMETLAQLDIACDIGYISDEDFSNIEQIILEETRLLQGMINKYKN